jgi:RNA polymerase sigma-70 factor (ECF subfamily)
MPDASAGENTPAGVERAVDRDRLELFFVIYNARLVRYLRGRLGVRWALADDLAQETWLQVARSLHTCRAADDKAFGWLCTIARRTAIHYFRLARNTREIAADFTGAAELGLPLAASAEDVAITRIIALMLAADSPVPLGVAA